MKVYFGVKQIFYMKPREFQTKIPVKTGKTFLFFKSRQSREA